MSVELRGSLRPLEDLARWSDHPSSYLCLNAGTLRFRADGLPGFVAYGEQGGWWFVLGAPISPSLAQVPLLAAFQREAARRKRRVCALQVRPGQVELYARAGFRINQLGTSFELPLEGFAPRGASFSRLRNKISRARRAGVEVVELGVELPRDEAAWRRLEAIDAAWLRAKGERALRFLVGELGDPRDMGRRVFVAKQGERWVGYVSYVPAYGRRAGILHDLSRRQPDAPPGSMERINMAAIQRFRSEGEGWLHFGLTPFAGVSPEHDDHSSRSRLVSWLTRQLSMHGGAVYPAASQAAYKRKWGAEETPEYVAFDGRYSPLQTWRLLQLTGAA